MLVCILLLTFTRKDIYSYFFSPQNYDHIHCAFWDFEINSKYFQKQTLTLSSLFFLFDSLKGEGFAEAAVLSRSTEYF
jgi:hypothetical protein